MSGTERKAALFLVGSAGLRPCACCIRFGDFRFGCDTAGFDNNDGDAPPVSFGEPPFDEEILTLERIGVSLPDTIGGLYIMVAEDTLRM